MNILKLPVPARDRVPAAGAIRARESESDREAVSDKGVVVAAELKSTTTNKIYVYTMPTS